MQGLSLPVALLFRWFFKISFLQIFPAFLLGNSVPAQNSAYFVIELTQSNILGSGQTTYISIQ
jgi:hypothetical protein